MLHLHSIKLGRLWTSRGLSSIHLSALKLATRDISLRSMPEQSSEQVKLFIDCDAGVDDAQGQDEGRCH